jgi:hypothetical protein
MKTRPSHVCSPRGARLAAACVLAISGSVCATAATRLSSVDEFNAGKARADAELLADRAACDKLFGTPRDVCREQARGKEQVAKAELELAHTGSRSSQDRLSTARMDAAYDVARTQCNDEAGAAKIVCTRQAQTMRAKAQADLKLHQRVSKAKRSSADKCDAMAADERAACMVAAKAGKS